MNRFAPAFPFRFEKPGRLQGQVEIMQSPGLPARLHLAAVLAPSIAAPPAVPAAQAEWAARLLTMADALCAQNAEDYENEATRQRLMAATKGNA